MKRIDELPIGIDHDDIEPARIFKVSFYVIDIDEQLNQDEIKILLDNCFYDSTVHNVKVENRDIDWYEESPLNRFDCPVEECEKYFI